MSTPALLLTSEDADALPHRFDAYSAVARVKLGVPETWEWYSIEVLRPTSDVLVQGAIPTNPTAPRGPRRWKGAPEGEKCVVTKAEQAAAVAEYERTSGKCAECMGSGRELAGWSRETGHKTQTCRRCRGSGAPNVKVPA